MEEFPQMTQESLQAFVDKWSASGASESSNSQYFLLELCDVLGVPRPDGAKGDANADDYVFEKDAPVTHEGGATSVKKIDLYRAGHFILEAKQGSERGSKKLGTAKRDTPGWNQAMNDAYGQALGYARSFDEPEPFIVVCDIGYCFELYSDFGADWQYRSFPNAQQRRIYLKDLPKKPLLVERLRKVFTDPQALDPAKNAAKVTREVAGHLAELAKRLEKAGHNQVSVAKFLMRCLFTMFAEDVGLLPDNLFTNYLRDFWVKSPASFPGGIQALWQAMNTGGNLPTAKVLRFNGGLFDAVEALPLDEGDIKLLLNAAECDWSDVEPAIFGTLLERALDANERHRLGAHYTPRAYVERLVRPTIEEPLREEWDQVRIEVRGLVTGAEIAKTQKASTTKLNKAEKILKAFHNRLLALRILDPACGTGNFLYVAMDTLKRLESEVLAELAAIQGGDQDLLHFEGARISPEQFLGIEIKPWAKEIAELVLWIGYLQWHFKQYGKTVSVPEPVLRDYKNIECRDAVVVERAKGPRTLEDEVAGRFNDPAAPAWPQADFIVGNPPFVGNKVMREALGDDYVVALRRAHPDVPDTSDLVMYWWHLSAVALKQRRLQQFGLISTKAISQVFNAKVVSRHLEENVSLVFVVPNHPWVDETGGAAVRVAMTVARLGDCGGTLCEVETEDRAGELAKHVGFRTRFGQIHPSLTVGADVRKAKSLLANEGLCQQGVKLVQPRGSDGFVVQEGALADFGGHGGVIKPYLSNKELMQKPKRRFVIDFHGFAENEAREAHPVAFERVLIQVKPFRDENRDAQRRRNWWLFGRSNEKMRESINGLARYIITPEVAKHRVFVFAEPSLIPDASLYAVASDDAFVLGVLSSRLHVAWAIRAGGRMGVGDHPRYQNGPCFLPFPMPLVSEHAEPIRELALSIDTHRKVRLEECPSLTLTGMYNVLESLRRDERLTAKEEVIRERGLISSLRHLHEQLDMAVFAAYGWPDDLTDEEVFERLVALNHERVEEEKRGIVQWLRPEFQNPEGQVTRQALQGVGEDKGESGTSQVPVTPAGATPWPKKLPEQITAIRDLVTPGAEWSAQSAANTFKAAKVDQVHEVMESLAALGMLIELEGTALPSWTAPRVRGG